MDMRVFKNAFKSFSISFLFLWSLILGGVAVFFIIFEELKDEVGGDPDLIRIDNAIMDFFVSHRSATLNGVAVDVTALGSTVIITSLVLFLIFFFSVRLHWLDELQIAIAGVSAGVLSPLFKMLAARPRPPHEMRLVEVSNFSYPSGHSLTAAIVYLTIGFIFFERYRSGSERVLCLLAAVLLVLAIGASRIYLGVHYPSDVLGGLTLGTSVALMIFAIRRAYQKSSEVSNHD